MRRGRLRSTHAATFRKLGQRFIGAPAARRILGLTLIFSLTCALSRRTVLMIDWLANWQ